MCACGEDSAQQLRAPGAHAKAELDVEAVPAARSSGWGRQRGTRHARASAHAPHTHAEADGCTRRQRARRAAVAAQPSPATHLSMSSERMTVVLAAMGATCVCRRFGGASVRAGSVQCVTGDSTPTDGASASAARAGAVQRCVRRRAAGARKPAGSGCARCGSGGACGAAARALRGAPAAAAAAAPRRAAAPVRSASGGICSGARGAGSGRRCCGSGGASLGTYARTRWRRGGAGAAPYPQHCWAEGLTSAARARPTSARDQT